MTATAVTTALLAGGLVAAVGVTTTPVYAAASTLSCTLPTDSAAPASTTPVTASAGETITRADGTVVRAFAGYFVGQAIARFGTTEYVAYYAAESKALTVAQRVGTGAWTFFVPTDAAGTSEALTASDDSHNNIAMTVDSAGGLHLMADMHSTTMNYWRTTTVGNISTLTYADRLVKNATYNAAGARTDDEGYITYPTFFTGPDGVMHLMFRSGWSNAGKTYIYNYSTGTQKWTPVRANTGGMVLNGWTGGQYSPYPDAPVWNPADNSWHLVWTWQNDGSATSTSTVNHMRSTDLIDWKNAAGVSQAMPVTYANTATVVDPVGEGGGLLNSNIRVGVDVEGKVSVTYFKYSGTATQLFIARRNSANTAWVVNQISNWTGRYDLTDTSKLSTLFVNTGAVPTGDDDAMAISYTCNGVGRTLTVTDGASTGSTQVSSDVPSALSGYPATVTAAEFPVSNPAYAGYKITWRITSAPISDTQSRIMKWESGAIVVNGIQPSTSTYPVAGSTLKLFTLTG